MKMSRRPKKIRNVLPSREVRVQGWWYGNSNSIEVFLRDDDGKLTICGRIPRAQLVAWIDRTPKRLSGKHG